MRKKRSDSVTEEGAMMREGAPNPPAHITLRKQDWPFWWSVVCARDFSSWNESDLEQAANLARCKCDLERLQIEITKEGDILENKRGTKVMNPKHTLLETLSRRSVALSRMLHVHAEATVGRAGDQVKRSEKQKEVKKNIQEADSLINQPTLQ